MKPGTKLRATLLSWFDRHRRDLPWRQTRDPYAIWISEVMLQQTQVVTVIPYWRRFLKSFPTVQALASAPEEAVFAHWKGLGYYSRARNLHKAAKQIVQQHGGQLPDTAEVLLELPGFGRYTSGAVASIAFGQQAPLVDGNVARVFSRLFAVEGAPGDSARERTLWEYAATHVVGPRPGDWNQALMELGALVCTSEKPTCLLCPVRNFCVALEQGRVDELPPARVRAARKALTLDTAAWFRDGAILLGRRPTGGLFGGLWELPSHEAVPAASSRPSTDELTTALSISCGAKVRVEASLGEVQRTLTHRDLTIRVHRVSSRQAPKRPDIYEALVFTPVDALDSVAMSTAMQRALALALAAQGS